MSTADDLLDLRDALDSIAHGALPRWGTATTKLGGEAQASDFRAHCEALTARCEAAELERDEARAALGTAWLTGDMSLAEGIRRKTAALEKLR
jgi:hypothetical protein